MADRTKRLSLDRTRRQLLALLGAGTSIGLAGCGGDDPEDTDDPGQQDDDTPEETPEETPGQDGELDYVEGGTLDVGLRINPVSFDPPYSTEAPATLVQELFFESMVTTDREGNLYPWLAESWEVEDVQDVSIEDYEEYMEEVPLTEEGFADVEEQVVMEHPDNEAGDDQGLALTVEQADAPIEDGTYGMHIRYQLHEGVEFSNGEEMTAENVVRSYERYENSDLSAQVWDQLLDAQVVDDYTVDLYAQVPDAEAERDLPVFVFSEEQIDLANGDLDPRAGNDPIGTGPWNLEEFEDEDYMVVSRRDDYWLEDVGLDTFEWWDGPEDFPEAPVIDEIDMTIIPDTSTRAGALEGGEIDLTYRLTADQRSNFDQADDFSVADAPGSGFLFAQLPVNVEPWDDQNVRRAFNHVIPRTQIVEQIRDGWATEAIVPIPEVAGETGTHDYEALEEELAEYTEYDPGRAEELLDEAGVDTPIEITLVTNADDDDRVRVVELVAEAMNQSGLFEATLETEGDLSALLVRMQDPEFATEGVIPFVGLSGTFNPDGYIRVTHHPDNYLQCCHYQDMNFPEINEGLDSAQFGVDVVEDPDLRRDRYEDVFESVLEANGNSYVDYELTTASHSQELQGYEMFPFPEGLLSYGLHSPQDEQLSWLERD